MGVHVFTKQFEYLWIEGPEWIESDSKLALLALENQNIVPWTL
jgi:hypothetical protein